MKTKNQWKRFRPNSNDELEAALQEERKLVARWYARISGSEPWSAGERERIEIVLETCAQGVNRMIQEQVISKFADLPDS